MVAKTATVHFVATIERFYCIKDIQWFYCRFELKILSGCLPLQGVSDVCSPCSTINRRLSFSACSTIQICHSSSGILKWKSKFEEKIVRYLLPNLRLKIWFESKKKFPNFVRWPYRPIWAVKVCWSCRKFWTILQSKLIWLQNVLISPRNFQFVWPWSWQIPTAFCQSTNFVQPWAFVRHFCTFEPQNGLDEKCTCQIQNFF